MMRGALMRRSVPAMPSVFASRSIATLDPSKLTVKKTDSPKPKLPKEGLLFGKTFTDHMLRCAWDYEKGWHAPRIEPYGKMELDPASSCLHYAIECFEGMKAYRGDKGEVRLFRPEMNMARMNSSLSRLYLPTFDGEAMLKLISELVALDKDFIPEGDGYSLYIRPTGISTEPTLGVGQSHSAEVFTICSPVGPYYPEGFKPVTLYATSKYTRAWPGGTGNTKIGGNYAPTILPQMKAAKKGFTQVLWLYGEEGGGEITEVGTMNLFVLWINEDGEKELVTAPLDGTVLPGVTRASVIEMAQAWGEFKVSERRFFMNDIAKACTEGRMIEVFGTGTAAVVSPVKFIHAHGHGYDIPLDPSDANAGAGPVTTRVWRELLDIQHGRVPSSDWSVVVA